MESQDAKTENPQLDWHDLAAELSQSVEGEVHFDSAWRAMYATDASNYRQVPIGVVVPKNKDDVLRAIAACKKFGAPVFSRGAGTSLAGQCCNVAVVLDFSKNLNRVLEINAAERWATVEAGTICDTLRRRAAPLGLTWGPDPATHTHCTFGGMLGNNSCGVHSQIAGKAVDNVIEMEVLLYDGTCLTVGWTNEKQMELEVEGGGRKGEIHSKLKALRSRYAENIRDRYVSIPRRVSGYNLDQLLPGADGRFNLARALVGSESTCVTILEAKVRLIPALAHRTLVVLGYPDIFSAADDVPRIVEFGPIGLEGFDEVTIRNIRKKLLSQAEYLSLLPQGRSWLLVEFGADSSDDAADHAHGFAQAMRRLGRVEVRTCIKSQDQRQIWSIRESALGANSFVPGEAPSWEGWEDSAVATDRLGEYLRELSGLFNKYEYMPAWYGHFGQGCVHNRVNFDFKSLVGIAKWRAFMEDATDLVVRYGGSLSGEHGDGQARGEFLHKMFGQELMQAFREFKAIWDPDWKMNPGKLVNPYPIDQDLRAQTETRMAEQNTLFTFQQDGGSFARAVGRCVGVGKCRRDRIDGEQDTMCPSYIVTREEKHSTRGRAHLLWEMLNGEVIRDGWRSEAVKDALDLCLACKGCKGDCPVNVDVASYKAEFLAHYWKGRIRPMRAYAFGWIDKWAKLASIMPAAANTLTQTPLLSSIAKCYLRVAPERRIPAFSNRTFRSWFQRQSPKATGGAAVLLWPDTFNNYFRPDTACAATMILKNAGYRVEIPTHQLCCGRPLYDHGFLKMAKTYLRRVISELEPQIAAGTPVVVLEPSCCSVFRDEMCDLLPDVPAAQKLAKLTVTLAEFLETHAPQFVFPQIRRKALVQGHCHHKAVMRMGYDKAVFERLGLDYHLLESGCCGMAGAFGYEKDKFAISQACGEHALFPAVRNAEPSTLIIADGFSCREQIEQSTGRTTFHLAEVLQMSLQQGLRSNAVEHPPA
jgi:FAD/FMN-containing dehydrogenase/Fe-S oxidoreductase